MSETVDVQTLYDALLRYYRSKSFIPWGDPKAELERDIAELVKKGLTREEAIKRLFEERIGPIPAPGAGRAGAPQVEGAKQVYRGQRYAIFYVETDPFYENLQKLGRVLDEIERGHGEVVAIIPNIGFVTASIFLGTSFQGVKGVAVVVKLRQLPGGEQQAPQP